MCVCIFEFLSMSDSRPHRYSCGAVINECMHIKQLPGIEKQLLTVSQCCSCPQANPSYPQATGGWGGQPLESAVGILSVTVLLQRVTNVITK